MQGGLTIALFTIAGGLFGALIKYILDKRTSAENARREKKLGLYSSFIDSFWRVTADIGKNQDPEAGWEMSRLANEIVLYGSEEVVRNLAPVIGRDYNQTTLTSLMIGMRNDILSEEASALFEPVRIILFDRIEKAPPPPSQARLAEEPAKSA